MFKKVIIHAVNVHQGGGRSVLNALLGAVRADVEYVVAVDARMQVESGLAGLPNVALRRVKPTVWSRFGAELWLRRHAGQEASVFCFGNLPPLFRLPSYVRVFVQNRYLIDRVPLSGLGMRVCVRIALERLWLRWAVRNTDEFVVQTPSMQSLLEGWVAGRVPVRSLPFAATEVAQRVAMPKAPHVSGEGPYVYVASGEPHKNHTTLIQAWAMLAQEGLFPELVLTVDHKTFPALCAHLRAMVDRHQLNIRNLGVVPADEVLSLYGRARALIYPSKFESFGLPLLEAKAAGLPILASELDYVRDLVDPVASFDPNSAVSIAKAVKRFMGQPSSGAQIHTPAEVMAYLLKGQPSHAAIDR